MKKVMKITIVLLVLVGSGISAKAIDNPVGMGVINYRDYEYITFVSADEVNLTFVSSDEFSHYVLDVQKIEYYPSNN